MSSVCGRFDVGKNGAGRRCLLVRGCRGAFGGFNASPTPCPQHQPGPDRHGAIEGSDYVELPSRLLAMCMPDSWSACSSSQLPWALDSQVSDFLNQFAPSSATTHTQRRDLLVLHRQARRPRQQTAELHIPQRRPLAQPLYRGPHSPQESCRQHGSISVREQAVCRYWS